MLLREYARAEIARDLRIPYTLPAPMAPDSVRRWGPGGTVEQIVHALAGFAGPGLPGTNTGRPIRRLAMASRRAPEFSGGSVTESGFLRSALAWLGPGYVSLPGGRYVSADGLRQLRFGRHETSGTTMHGHFEAYDIPGGRVIENTRVLIVPDAP